MPASLVWLLLGAEGPQPEEGPLTGRKALNKTRDMSDWGLDCLQ